MVQDIIKIMKVVPKCHFVLCNLSANSLEWKAMHIGPRSVPLRDQDQAGVKCSLGGYRAALRE